MNQTKKVSLFHGDKLLVESLTAPHGSRGPEVSQALVTYDELAGLNILVPTFLAGHSLATQQYVTDALAGFAVAGNTVSLPKDEVSIYPDGDNDFTATWTIPTSLIKVGPNDTLRFEVSQISQYEGASPAPLTARLTVANTIVGTTTVTVSNTADPTEVRITGTVPFSSLDLSKDTIQIGLIHAATGGAGPLAVIGACVTVQGQVGTSPTISSSRVFSQDNDQHPLTAVLSVAAGSGISVDSSDPFHPVVSATFSGLGNNSVTNAILAQAAARTLKGNNSGSTGNVSDLTVAQVKTLLAITPGDVMVSATDKVLGRVSAGAGPAEEIACTSTGRSLLAAATPQSARDAIGIVDVSILDCRLQAINYMANDLAWTSPPSVRFYDSIDLAALSTGVGGAPTFGISHVGQYDVATGASASTAFRLFSSVKTVPLTESATRKWWMGTNFKIGTGVDANTAIRWGLVGGAMFFGCVADKGGSATNFGAVITYGGNTYFLDSGVAIDTNWHVVRVWCSAGTMYLAVDSVAPVSRAIGNCAGDDTVDFWVGNGATAANRAVSLQWMATGVQHV